MVQIGKIPPHSIELEIAILGAIMIERNAAGRIINDLTGEDFYDERHKTIYNSIKDLYIKSKPIDILTVAQTLRDSNKLDLIGGAYYISSLTNNVASAANIEYHATLIKQYSLHRNLINTLSQLLTDSWDENIDPFEFSKSASYKIEISTESLRSDMSSLGKIAVKTYDKIIAASEDNNELLGLPSSLTQLNDLTGGYSAPDLIIIAGGTGEGKSTLALNEAYHIAKKGHPIAFFSLEMKDYQLTWKILSSEINTDVTSLRKGWINQIQKNDLFDTVRNMSDIPFYIYDLGNLDINKFCGIVKEAKRKQGIELCVVDYLQLLRSSEKHGSREQEVSYISKRLKSLAMELNIPIIALSQLSRIEKGTKRMYRLSDLRESGALEQDADSVIFVYNPAYHEVNEMDGQVFTEGDIIITIAKMRMGDTGKILAKFNGKHSKFENHLTF